ncbi:hypothetical protein [Nocardia yunnanensis]|uniref:hypothetical protein n=1 Tax=Nocardia yunnanensis TaxID=2382165 RepID=UPI0013C52F1E|nr:hypothetical protein [Nocardia yunnanensis]
MAFQQDTPTCFLSELNGALVAQSLGLMTAMGDIGDQCAEEHPLPTGWEAGVSRRVYELRDLLDRISGLASHPDLLSHSNQ